MCWKTLLMLVACLHRSHCFSHCISRAYLSCRQSALLGQHKQCTITGVEIIRCRPFTVSEPKLFTFCGSYRDVMEMPASIHPEVAFVGRSNVGKSSLLNALTGQRKKVAIESSTPGTTRQINLYECRTNSGPLCSFADLPGYGYAKLSQNTMAAISSFVRDYLLARKPLKLVVLLLDARREPNKEDQDLLQFLLGSGHRVAIAATKLDKIRKGEIQGLPNRVRELLTPAFSGPDSLEVDLLPVIPVSSLTGDGKTELWKIIRGSLLAEE